MSDDPRQTRIDACAGIGFEAPALSFPPAIFLLSLAGIPSTAGFIGKFDVLKTARFTAPALRYLVVIAIVTSIVSIYYYFRRRLPFQAVDEPRLLASPGLRAVEDPPDPLPAPVVEVVIVRASLDSLRHPVLGIVEMLPHAVEGLVAGHVIRHRAAVGDGQPVGRRIDDECLTSHTGDAGSRPRHIDRPVALPVVSVFLREEERDLPGGTLPRLAHLLDPVERIVLVVVDLRHDISSGAQVFESPGNPGPFMNLKRRICGWCIDRQASS